MNRSIATLCIIASSMIAAASVKAAQPNNVTNVPDLPKPKLSTKPFQSELIKGQNFSNEPGKLAVLTYKVYFQNAGRY